MGDCRSFSDLFFVLNDRDGILHHMEGHKAPTIARLLREEGVKVSRVGILKFVAKFQETGLIGRRIGSGRPSKITAERKKLDGDQIVAFGRWEKTLISMTLSTHSLYKYFTVNLLRK